MSIFLTELSNVLPVLGIDELFSNRLGVGKHPSIPNYNIKKMIVLARQPELHQFHTKELRYYIV